MGKSLTDVAKAVLMNEGAIPSVSSSQSNPDRDATFITPNKATLRPGSRGAEGRFSNPGAISPNSGEVQDLGPALVKQGDIPPSAKAAGSMGKDMSPSSQASRGIAGAEPFGVNKKGKSGKLGNPEALEEDQYVNGEVMEEDIEISEELEDFIAEMAAQGLSEDEIAEAIDENFELVSEEDQQIDEEAYQVDMSEHVEALLAGEELSEEFKEKAKTIFEAAVMQKLAEEVARLEEAYAEALEEEVATITESLSEDVDDYLNYVVENWVSENEIAIEHGLRTELTEDFISGLRQLFAENYIDIPEDKVSVVEELGSKVEELESKLNEEIERNVALNRMINESKQYEILGAACDGLTVTQAEKLKALSEGIEFTTESEYGAKIRTLRESYFPSGVRSDNVLDRAESSDDSRPMLSEDTSPRMAAYVRTLGKKLPN